MSKRYLKNLCEYHNVEADKKAFNAHQVDTAREAGIRDATDAIINFMLEHPMAFGVNRELAKKNIKKLITEEFEVEF